MTPKDQKIIEDSERLGIPIFVLTAKDYCSIGAMLSYLQHCNAVECPKNHTHGIKDRIEEFEEWQEKNEGLVKNPD